MSSGVRPSRSPYPESGSPGPGGGWRRRLTTSGVLGVAAALVASLAVAVVPGATTDAAAAAGPKSPKAASRPDLVSARVTARAQGSRVEVEALREATSTTWVNPDGTLTTQQHGGPIRYQGLQPAAGVTST